MSGLDTRAVLEIKKALDETDIPKHDRCMKFIGKDGKLYTVYTDRVNDAEAVQALQDVLYESER